jgi:hypothetical protein
MNCPQCNAPLAEQARFCPVCGSPVATGSPTMPSAGNNSPTIPTPLGTPAPQAQYTPQAPLTLPASQQWNAPPGAQPVSPQPQYAPQGQWMPQAQSVPPQIGSMQSSGTLQGRAATRRRRRWPLRLLIALIILLVVLAGGWFFVGRPILHSIAQNQFDQLASSQVNLIPPVPLPPVVNSLPITENGLNNLITLAHSPSSPVQDAVAHIAPAVVASDGSYTGGVEFDFQLFGFSCSVRGIPIATNGQIVMTQVQVGGILSLIMSSDEMTTLLNAHLQDAVTRLGRQITNVTLKNQELDIQLSPGPALP